MISVISLPIEKVLEQADLRALFQPIIDLETSAIIGYEGLIRGPRGSSMESPLDLIASARLVGRHHDLERLCLRILWKEFQYLGLPGKLFVNLSLEMLQYKDPHFGRMYDYMETIGVDPKRIVLEITEDQRADSFLRLRRIAKFYAARDYSLGIDDLGAGFASLRLWLELRPAYVKVDIAFVQGVERDEWKAAFLEAIQYVATKTQTHLIAEGIENSRELGAVQRLKIAFGQGYFIARPSGQPLRTVNLTENDSG